MRLRLAALPVAFGVSLSLIALAGCSANPQAYARSPEISALRASAAAQLDHVLGAFEHVTEVFSHGTDDVCDPGQHNTLTNDMFRLSCTRTQRILAAPLQTDPTAAASAVKQVIDDLGCTVTYDHPEDTAAALRSQYPGALVYSATCGEVSLDVNWITDPTKTEHDYLHWVPRKRSMIQPPNGFTYEFTNFTDAELTRVSTCKPFAWWIDATVFRYAYVLN